MLQALSKSLQTAIQVVACQIDVGHVVLQGKSSWNGTCGWHAQNVTELHKMSKVVFYKERSEKICDTVGVGERKP